jgi:hypothetical protein
MKDSGAEIFKNKMDSRINSKPVRTSYNCPSYYKLLSFNNKEMRNSALLEIKAILKSKKNR